MLAEDMLAALNALESVQERYKYVLVHEAADLREAVSAMKRATAKALQRERDAGGEKERGEG